MESVKIIKNLVGEFVSSEVVKAATQREYNSSEWNKTVDRYSKYEEVQFFKTPGTIYEFNYYVVYIADGIRFLGEVTYSSCLSNGSFSYGFFMVGMKDKEAVEKLVAVYPEMKDIGKDSLTCLSHTAGRIGTSIEARVWMRKETANLKTRFFTKCF